MPPLSEEDKLQAITALQALSTFYLYDSPPVPGYNYTPVAIRCLARFLNRDSQQLRAELTKLAGHGFCEVTPDEARLTPDA